MMTVGSVGYLGSTPATSVFGLASVFLYIVPAIVFLVPVALVAAELASGWQGGVYNWVSEGISPPMGLLAVWCEFSQTIFYYPALLGYVGTTLVYAIDRRLAGNGVYTAAVIIVLFWTGVLVSSRGTSLAARLSSSGTLIGTLIPGAVLVILGVIYLLQGNSSAAPMGVHHLVPPWHGFPSIVLVVNSFFTFAGVEVSAIHVDELRNPGREYPRATFLAMGVVLAIFILPTLAIAWVIPAAHISLTAGVMQAFNRLLTHFGLSFALPIVAVALAVGALAGMLAWLDGPSEGLLRIGREQGYLPPRFQKTNGAGHRGQHPRGSRRGGHVDRPALRGRPHDLTCVLDFHGDGHAGLPDHVCAHVHLRTTPPPHPTGAPAWLQGPGSRPALPARWHLIGSRVHHRVRTPVAARPPELPGLRRVDPRGIGAYRTATAPAHGSAAQARVEKLWGPTGTRVVP